MAETNPFLTGGGTSANPFLSAAVADVGAVASSPAGTAVRNKLSGVGKALDAQRYGLARLLTGKTDPDDQRTQYRKALGAESDYHDDRLFGVIPQPKPLANLERGVLDFGIDTVTDPISYESLGAAPLLRGMGKLGSMASGVAREMVGRSETMGHVANALVHGGAARAKYGFEPYAETVGHLNRQAARGDELTKRLSATEEAIVGKLSPEDLTTVYKLVRGHRVKGASAELAAKADQLRTLTKNTFIVRADPAARARARGFVTGKGAAADNARAPQMIDRTGGKQFDPTAARNERRDLLLKNEILKNSNMAPMRKATKLNAVAPFAHTTPENLREFGVKATGAEPTLGGTNYRRNYLPRPNKTQIAGDEQLAKVDKEFDTLAPFDPNKKTQTFEGLELNVDNAPKYREAFRAMLENTGRQVGASEARGALKDTIADKPELAALGKVKIGPEAPTFEAIRNRWQSGDKPGALADLLSKTPEMGKKITQYPRAGITSLTPAHALNVARLLAVRDPGAIPATAKLFAKSMKPGADNFDVFRSGVDAGVVAPAEDKIDMFHKLAGMAPLARSGIGAAAGGIYGASQGGTPQERLEHAGEDAGLGAAGIHALPHWTKAMSKIVWNFDDAAKTTLAARNAARTGEAPMVAGRRAAQSLVDYKNVGGVTQALRYIDPFATFRSAIPGAVAQSIARKPREAAAINRATQGVYLGGTTKTDDGKTIKSYGPTEDVSRLTDNPVAYARAMTGEPIRAALTAAGVSGMGPDRKTGKMVPKKDYFTYGLGLDPRTPDGRTYWVNAALAGVPGATDVLEGAGFGRFGDTRADATSKALYKFTGVSSSKTQ